MSINLEEIKARNKEYLDQARKVTEGNSPTTVSDIYLKQSKDNLANKIEAERQYYAEESAKNEQRRQDQLALAAQQQAAKEAARHNDEGFIPNTVEYHKDSQFKQREATAVDRAEDTAAAIAKGLGGVYKTGTTLVTAGKYGLSKVAAKTLDREFNQTLQEALDQGDQTAGVNHLNSYLDRIGSQVNKDKLQELQAIMDTPGLTNMEQYRKRMAFYRANPSIAAYEVIQSAVKSGIELYFSGGLTKAVGLGVKSGVATGVGLPGSVDHIQTIQSKGKADDSTLLNAAGVGGLYAAFGLAAKGMGGADFDSIFVRAAQGGRNTVVGGGVKGAVKTVVPEVWEETLQTGTSVVGANAELGEELTKDMGSNVAAAQAGAIGQSGSMHLFSKSGDGLVKTVNKGLEKYADKKNGTTEDNLNPEHAKFSPTRAMDTALAYKNSADPKQREEANKIMSRTTQVTYQRMLDITAEIELASTPEARKEAEDKKAKFEAEQLGPLVAQIKTYQKANEQNSKALFSLMDDFHKNKPEAVQKHLDSTQLIENKKKELQERITTAQANTPEIKVAPRTSYSTGNTQAAQSSGKGSLSTLIQGGESGSMGYSAVNYGNKKAGTVNLAGMTYGQVVANQRAGTMVAVGKYQFHKVSLKDAIKVLPWLKPNTLMTPEVQDKIFVEYYIGRKRKGMANYIRGGNTSLNTAANEFASEWASAQGTNGKGQYAGNSVSITTGSVQSHLQGARAAYAAARKAGKSDSEALHIATLSNNNYGAGVTTGTTTNTVKDPKNYIKYSNQGKTRDKPLSTTLEQSMGFLQDMGITMHVSSGGQDAQGPKRTGSHRHDNGGAGDVDFYKNGKPLKHTNAEDRAVISEIITTAVANGVTGVGVAYMGDGRVHIGYGTDAVWSGKGTKAPAWAVEAHKKGVALRGSGYAGNVPQAETDSNSGTANVNIPGVISSDTDTSTDAMANHTFLADEINKTQEIKAPEPRAVYVEPKEETAEAEFIRDSMQKTRALFNSMTDEQIEAHPLLSDDQKVQLRQLTQYKRALADMQDPDTVSGHVLEGHQGATAQQSHLGLKQYAEIFTNAITTNDVDTVNKHLGYLKRFNDNHQAKNEAIQLVLEEGVANAMNPVWVAPTEDGKWIRTEDTGFVSKEREKELKAAGAFKVTGDNKGTRGVQRDAANVATAYEQWFQGTAAIMEGVAPMVAQTRGSRVVNQPAAPVEVAPTTPTDPTVVQTTPTGTSTPTAAITRPMPTEVAELTQPVTFSSTSNGKPVNYGLSSTGITIDGNPAPQGYSEAINDAVANDQATILSGKYGDPSKAQDTWSAMNPLTATYKSMDSNTGTELTTTNQVTQIGNKYLNTAVTTDTAGNVISKQKISLGEHNSVDEALASLVNTLPETAKVTPTDFKPMALPVVERVQQMALLQAEVEKTNPTTPMQRTPAPTTTPTESPVATAQQPVTTRNYVSQNTPEVTAPVDFGNVQRAHSADAIADNPNAVYIGRSGFGKETKSMSQVNAQTGEGIGNPGWLGSTAGRSLGQEADLAEYNHQFKRRFEATPNFAEAVIDLKNKELYVNAHASKGSEAGYVSALLKVLPDDPTEAKAFVRRIESFNPDTGFTLGAEVAPKVTPVSTTPNESITTYTPSEVAPVETTTTTVEGNAEVTATAPTTPNQPTEQGDTINVTDDTFSFSDTNDFNLSTVNDEKYDENTAAIDEAIKKLKDANRPLTFPTTGVGKALIAAAPRTLAYFNKKVSEEFGIQNGSLLASSKQTPSRANNRTTDLKNRSNVVSTGNTTNRKYSNTAVAEPIQATKVRDERNHGTTETINDYTNTYSGSDSTGAERNVVITRDSKTNKVKSITVENKATGKSHPQNVEDDTYSDELIVTQVANKIAHLKPVFKQAAKQDTVASETEVDGRTLPTELLGKEANLEKTMELHADKIEAGKRDEATKAIYQQLLKPILNINPKMKLKIVEGDGTNAYDKDSNTIVINTKANPDSTIQEEINRLAIESAIKDVIHDMENPGQIKDAEKLEKLEKLTNDVANLMTTVWEAINNPEGAYTKLDPKVQAKINNAMEDAKSLLTSATSDIEVIKFLKEVPLTDKRKAKSNVFSRIVKAVSSYFNMGNSKTIDNAFASAVEITARMASEQSRDVTVRFDKDIAAKLSVFQMDDTKLAMQAAKQQLVRYYERNQFIATFTQKATLAKPLTSITNFTAKLKLDMMQGIEKFTKTPPTAKQRDQVADFIKFRDDFAIHARKTFVAKEPKYITDKETGEQTLVTDFRYQDLKSYMLDDQGNLSENTITGLALAAYNWAIEFGNKETNEEKDIKKLLNVDPDSTDALPANIREQYMYKGAIKTFTVLELGKSATDVLNIKDNEWASEHTMSRLHASLGEWALSAMQAADLVHIHTMPSDVHQQNAMDVGSESASTYEISDKGVVSFVSITNEQGSDINTRLAEIVHASRGTQDYLGNLFGTEVGLRAPLLEKPSTVKTVIKRTLSVMSSKQQKLVAKMQEEPMAVNVDMLNTLEILLATDRQATLQMIGALVTDEELALEHKDDRASKVSAAQGVLRDLENGLDFTSSLEKLPNGERQQFYDTVYAAKNNRMHYNSNMFNLQSSKLHRSMGEYVNFKTDVDIANEVSSKGVKVYDDKGNVTLTATFLRAIAESAEGTEKIIEAAMAAKGLVVSKGYTVDKVASEFFIEPFYNYLSTDPDVQAAMVGIRKTLKNEKPTTKEVADILKVVKFWKGGPNSLRALTEYTKFADSIANGDAKFTTSLGLGSDGINNGSAISYVQLGDASDLFQTQVGMLPKAGKYGGFNNYLETRFNTEVGDYYTGFAPHVEEAVVGIDPALGAFPKETEANYKKREKEYQVRQKALEVILALNTTYKARKSFKAVLIPFGYSAGMPRLRRLVYAQFLDDIKSTMKKLSAMDTTSDDYAKGHAALQYNLNQMLGAKNAVELPHGKELLEFSFNYTQAKTLWNAYDSVMGETTEQALKGYAKSFMALRDHNIGIQQAAEKTYQGLKEIIYNQEMEKYKAEVAKKYPDVSDVRKDADTPSALEKMINAEGIPKAYYDKHFKPKLDAVRPGVKTPFNHDEEGDTSATDFRVVKEVSKVTADPASQGVNYKVQDGKYSSTNTMLPMRYSVEESVGVMVNSAQVQGTDGVIAATASALGGQVNLNVHDAAIGGIANHVAMTQMQNKATYEALRDYSAMTSSLLALSNTIRAVAVNRRMGVIDNEMQQYLVTEAVVAAYTKSVIKEQLESSGLNDPSTGEAYSIEDIHEDAVYKEFILPLLYSLSEDVIAVEMNKYKILEDMGVMHQYGGEGGQYVITDKDRAGIETAKNKMLDTHTVINENLSMLEKESFIEHVKPSIMPKQTEEASSKEVVDSTPSTDGDTQGRELVTNAVENMTKPMSVEDFQKITETGYNRTERHLQDLVKSGELSVNSSGKYSKVGAVSTSIDRAEKSKVVSKTDKKEAAGATIEVSKPVSISAVINSLNTLQQKRGMDVQPHRAEAIKYLTKRLTAMQASDTRELKVQVVDSIPDGASGNYDAARGLLTISAEKFNSMNADKQMELLQHEMWHALSVITASQSTNPIVRESYNELEMMRKELLSKFPKDSHMYKYVLQNVEEMIAYGMTDTEVANQIADNLTGKYKAPIDPATGKPVKITTGLLKFVEKVAQFFTGKRSSTKEGYKNYVLFTRLADVMTTPPTAREVAAYQALPVKQVYNSTAKPTDFIKELSATNVSPEQNARLDGLIEGPIAQFMEASEQNKVEVLDIADDPNNLAVQAGFKLSDKEVAVIDILKYSAGTFLASEAGTKTAAEIRANYYQVTDQLKREDFLADPANATPQEIRAAQKKLDYIKKMDNVNSVEHLERYVSLILVSPEFQAVADKINNKRKAEQHEGAFNKVMAFFVDLMQKLVGKTMLTTGAKSSDEISILYSRLTKIVDKSAERKANMVDNTVMMAGRAVVAPVNYTLSKLTNAIFGSLNLASTMAPNSTLGTAARVAYKVRQNGGILPLVDEAGDYAARLNSYNGKQGLGPLGELLVEMSRNVGMKQTTEELIRMTTKASIDRQTMATSATKKLGELFKDLSSVPNEQLDSVTQVALRADVSSLLNHGVNINRVVKLLTKPNERAKEIQRLEQDIKRRSPNFNDIILQTKTLGVYMSREVAGSHLVKNAEGIAIGQGSWYATDMASMDARLFASIDQLASLYAVDLATDEQKAAFNTLQANDPEAVKGILNHHLEMTKRSKEDLRHNAINYIKGYMPQKTHHLRSLKFAENLTEINKLKAQGWQVIGDEDMGQDKHDNTLERTLMYHKDAHYKDYVSGALDMKDTHAKGTTIYSSSNGTELMRVSKDMLADRRARNQTSYENYNVLKQGESNLIAAYDAEGGLTNYHYEMSGRLRDTYLERNNNSLELLGMLHAKLVSAPQIQDTQRGVATAVYEDFEKSWLADPRKFITLDPRSEDPKIVKMWRMMPYAFQQEAQALFGQGNPIVIRATIFNSVFGYHVYSISEMFDKSTSEKNTFEKLVTAMLDTIFDKKGQLMILRAERAIQSGVAQIKDFIVIRNVKVLVGNIVANSLLLTAQGVPPSQQVKDFVSVWRNGGRYRKLAALVAETDAAIAINRNRPAVLRDLNRKRKQALQEMSQNPLHDFMEKGMMSSIVEDTAVFKEDTGFKSDLENKLEELKDKLPQKVLTAFEWAVTSPGTPLHNFLAHSTQFSDLAAKYSLTRHRMAEGMSSKDAIAEAQDAFINYDVPTGRGLDYMNKMGLFMFTKFLIRFQQVMVKQLEKNAAGVIAQHMAVEHFTNTSGLLDPLLINRIGNPFSAGIFGYGSAFGGITSMNVITGNF